MKILNVIGWLATLAFYCYVIYLTFFKADPTLRDIMLVTGVTCLDVGFLRSHFKKEQ